MDYSSTTGLADFEVPSNLESLEFSNTPFDETEVIKAQVS